MERKSKRKLALRTHNRIREEINASHVGSSAYKVEGSDGHVILVSLW